MRSYLGLSKLDKALFLWQLLHMHIHGQEHVSIPANTDQDGLGSSSANRSQEGTERDWWVSTLPSAPAPSSVEQAMGIGCCPRPSRPPEARGKQGEAISRQFLCSMTALAWSTLFRGTRIWLEPQWVSELILGKCCLWKSYLHFNIKKPTEVHHFVNLRGHKLAVSSVYQKVEIMWLLLKMLV